MTGFRTDWLRAAAVAAAVLAWAPGAAAQTPEARTAAGPPIPLGGDSSPAAPDGTALPPDDAGAVGPQSGIQAGTQAGIQVRSLGSVDGPPIGLMDSSNGGLGSDIWRDTPRSRVEDMFARLPLASPVASVRTLARRLVLTTADAPTGDAPRAFLSARLRALLDAGMLEDAGNLAARAVPKNDPELARLVADSILFAGHSKDVCGPATNTRLESGERFWIELRAYCYAVSGDSGALELTRAVMQAQKVDSRGFELLLGDVISRRTDIISRRTDIAGRIAEPDALDVFLLRTLGLPIEPDWSQRLGMPVMVIAMRDAKDSPDQRLAAAEDAARAGAATAMDLAIVADAQVFAPDQLGRADSLAPTLPFLAGQALLRQVVRNSSDPAVKKKLLFEALALAYAGNVLPLAAQLQGSALSAIVPDRADKEHAALMASALMLGGRAEAAARWYDVLDLNSPADVPLIHLLQAELNLVAPNPARAFEAQGALLWFAAQASAWQQADGEETPTYALLALGLYDALGMAMPPAATAGLAQWKSQQWPGRAPGPDVLATLASARNDSGRRGDAILSLLDFIGAEGPGDAAPDVAVALVKALAQMGFGDAAHDLAVDALLLRRVPAPASAS